MSRLRHAAPRLVREGGVDGQPRIREVVRHRIERVAVGLHRSRRSEIRRLTVAVTITVAAVVIGWIGPVPHNQTQPIFVPAQPAGAVPDSPPPGGDADPPEQVGQPDPNRPGRGTVASRSADRITPTGDAGGAPAQTEPRLPDAPPVGAAPMPAPPPTADTPAPLPPPQPGGKKPPKPKPPHPHVDLPDQAHNPNPPGQDHR